MENTYTQLYSKAFMGTPTDIEETMNFFLNGHPSIEIISFKIAAAHAENFYGMLCWAVLIWKAKLPFTE